LKKESEHPFLGLNVTSQEDIPFVFVNGREINFLHNGLTEENLEEVFWCHSGDNEEKFKRRKTYS